MSGITSAPTTPPRSEPVALAWADDAEAARLRIDHAPFGRHEVVTEEALALRRSLAVPAADADGDADAGAPAFQSMTGTFERVDDALVFTPRFVFVSGVRYVLLVDGEPVASLLRPVAPPPVPTTVTGIFPTGTHVPVNLLRLYIQFSAPMSEGFAAQAIRLTDAETGAPIRDALLDFTHELWDPARTRLTVLFEPGRIKRGLVPHLESGFPLMQGRGIVVTVDASFKDASGRPLEESFSRRYQVGPALTTRVDPASWVLTKPLAGTTAGLHVTFDRALDRGLLGRCLGVRDAGGHPIDGDVHVAGGERMWSFRPRAAWPPGAVLAVDTRLEDTCGNSVLRPFDRDLTDPQNDPAPDGRVVLLDAVTPRA
ncbi:MAG: hypothetical protein AB7P67_13015 [Vicinamibacterales bacterium]